jgi:hypothetical protein
LDGLYDLHDSIITDAPLRAGVRMVKVMYRSGIGGLR